MKKDRHKLTKKLRFEVFKKGVSIECLERTAKSCSCWTEFVETIEEMTGGANG